jgi:hypothetical protein
MKKSNWKLILLFILTIASASTNAQGNKYLVGLRYGYSLPMGQFASHEFDYGAYALLGTSFSAEGTRYFNNGLGVGANLSVGFYPVATGYYLQDLDSNDVFGGNFNMKSSPYEVRTYMGGAYYRLPVSEKFHASFKALGGICWSKSPEQFYSAEYFMLGTISWYKTSALSTRFSFLVGTSLNYKLFDHVELILESEFSYVESKFTFLKNGMTTKEVQSMKMPLFKLQPGLNITF